MSLPRRLEQVGIVVGSVLMLSLPVSAFTPVVFSDLAPWQVALLWCTPGLVVGVLVALDRFPVSYRQVWTFGIVSWAATLLLWAAFDVESATVARPTAAGTWAVALLVGVLVAWASPRIRWPRNGT